MPDIIMPPIELLNTESVKTNESHLKHDSVRFSRQEHVLSVGSFLFDTIQADSSMVIGSLKRAERYQFSTVYGISQWFMPNLYASVVFRGLHADSSVMAWQG